MIGMEQGGGGDKNPFKLELNNPSTTSLLAIDEQESSDVRIKRLISENPAVIFSRSSCCMCHVMKSLLHTIGVHPIVIELDEDEIRNVPEVTDTAETPSFFVGGTRVGGLEALVGLHLTNRLLPLLLLAGACS